MELAFKTGPALSCRVPLGCRSPQRSVGPGRGYPAGHKFGSQFEAPTRPRPAARNYWDGTTRLSPTLFAGDHSRGYFGKRGAVSEPLDTVTGIADEAFNSRKARIATGSLSPVVRPARGRMGAAQRRALHLVVRTPFGGNDARLFGHPYS